MATMLDQLGVEPGHRVLEIGAGGRLVAPLDLRGVQVSVALERAGDHWAGRSVAPCGFMRMRGAFAGPEAIVLRRDPELMLGLPEWREIGDVPAALDAEPDEGGGRPAHPRLRRARPRRRQGNDHPEAPHNPGGHLRLTRQASSPVFRPPSTRRRG
ncbi:hypothetical protein HD596_007435 [Nonomuraea jabiensis]|uniref:Uncharacterized protein n=2 Tax=Nonomuraea jabiensis TaxID=882448 RepID=A0A7W9GBE5_9ACTN|nr:hypothetical protein [Nonomuraea jabiensis]